MTDGQHRKTLSVQARYNRIARFYDLAEMWLERTFRKWRRLLWARVGRGRVLEVGVGTGKNLPYKPEEAEYIGIDLSPKMLERASRRATSLGMSGQLALVDAQSLPFADRSFDWIVATFVFCSVPDPTAGLMELVCVCKRRGKILLLEHVRSDNPLISRLMDSLNPIASRITGANINRRTVDVVRRAGLDVVAVEELGMGGTVKLITAKQHESHTGSG